MHTYDNRSKEQSKMDSRKVGVQLKKSTSKKKSRIVSVQDIGGVGESHEIVQRQVFTRMAPGNMYFDAINDAIRRYVPRGVQINITATDFAGSYQITFDTDTYNDSDVNGWMARAFPESSSEDEEEEEEEESSSSSDDDQFEAFDTAISLSDGTMVGARITEDLGGGYFLAQIEENQYTRVQRDEEGGYEQA